MSARSSFSSLVPFAVALVCGTSTSVGHAQSLRDLSVEQTQVFAAGTLKPGSLSVMTLLDRADATYAVGETVRLAIKTNEDAYVTVLNVSASGNVTQLFPNAAQADNRVKAGETVEIPPAASGAQIKVTSATGAELVKVVATSKPLTIIPEAHWKPGVGLFRSLDGDAAALNRNLAVVAANSPVDVKVATANQVIRTVPARGTAEAPTQGALVVPVAPPEPQTFPLLLAADKPTYRVGETIALAVTTTQACHLTVASTGAKGMQLLFPSVALPTGQIAAGQTVMISGTPAQSVVAMTPGRQEITALCTREPRPHTIALRTAADAAAEDDRQALERDLAAVAAKPAGTVGLARVALTVVP